jgi:hypothetical protein
MAFRAAFPAQAVERVVHSTALRSHSILVDCYGSAPAR